MEVLLTSPRDNSTLPLSKRLKLETHAAHDRVDKAVMALSPFSSLANYHRFLAVQYQFHRHTASLYHQPALNDLFQNLAERCRYALVMRDCEDLRLDFDALEQLSLSPPALTSQNEAVGWLYVSEGSHLGAAFLLKYAGQLGLSSHHGARHLAPSEAGRGLHWRNFTAQLDILPFSNQQRCEACEGARQAFEFVKSLTRLA